MSGDRMTCPKCKRPNVAVRNVQGAKVRGGKVVPPLYVPVSHNRLDPKSGEPSGVRCDYGQRRGRRT